MGWVSHARLNFYGNRWQQLKTGGNIVVTVGNILIAADNMTVTIDNELVTMAKNVGSSW
jgi:lipopolysaccharide export system protein LptA